MTSFEIGDKVRIVTRGADSTFNDSMAGCAGKISNIEENETITKGRQLCKVDVPGFGQDQFWGSELVKIN